MKPDSNQDREAYYKQGEDLEVEFVECVAPIYGLTASVNPDKKTKPYVPDLVVAGEIAELKTQREPFYSSGRMFGMNPQTTVTLNPLPLMRYIHDYPFMDVYFRVNFRKSFGYGVAVAPFEGVWMINVQDLAYLASLAPVHHYKERVGDTYNNQSAYVLDLNDMIRLRKV